MTRALFIIDVQNDFTEGGALGVEGGTAVAVGVSELLAKYPTYYSSIFASRDWHDIDSDNGGHFARDEAPDFNTTWPVHCVAGTPGAEYHPALVTDAVTVHIRKGQGKPAYSIFEGTTDDGETVGALLTEHGVTDIDVVGIATDHCIRASTLDALEHGQHVRLFTDLIAGVAAETSEAALAEMAHAGATLATSDVVSDEAVEATKEQPDADQEDASEAASEGTAAEGASTAGSGTEAHDDNTENGWTGHA